VLVVLVAIPQMAMQQLLATLVEMHRLVRITQVVAVVEPTEWAVPAHRMAQVPLVAQAVQEKFQTSLVRILLMQVVELVASSNRVLVVQAVLVAVAQVEQTQWLRVWVQMVLAAAVAAAVCKTVCTDKAREAETVSS
jgi:hypothetical protein